MIEGFSIVEHVRKVRDAADIKLIDGLVKALSMSEHVGHSDSVTSVPVRQGLVERFIECKGASKDSYFVYTPKSNDRPVHCANDSVGEYIIFDCRLEFSYIVEAFLGLYNEECHRSE